jgi:hypothetical protein
MNYFWRLILIPLLLTATITACNKTSNTTDNEANTSSNTPETTETTKNETATNPAPIEGKVIQSTDGKSQVVVPEGWATQTDLNDAANLQIADVANENYLIVISEPKADFDNISIEKHSEITRGFILNSIEGDQVSAPVNLTINGHPALQYEITGTIDNINVVYYHTTVETGSNFHQILAWTLPSKLDANKPVLESVINSFQEN